MTEKEQVKPLAPSAFQSRSDEESTPSSPHRFTSRQRKYIKCFGCFTAVLLIIAVIILILSFTVFHIKNPKINVKKITLLRPDLLNGLPRNDTNITLAVDVTVKNPNVVSFKFNNGTTSVFYGGIEVGEAKTPSGVAKARRTIQLNVTVDILADKIWQIPNLLGEVLSSKKLSMTSSTVIRGKVKIANLIKKYLTVEVNCTITYSLLGNDIQQKCRPHFL